jgi:hypothetical protein
MFHRYFSALGLIVPCLLTAQQNETEPNESVLTANNWTYGQTMSAMECNPVIGTDYFRIVLPSDGVISFTVISQGSGPDPADLQFALFPKSGFYQQYHTLPATIAPSTTSFSHSCLSGDTMYVRVQTDETPGINSCTSYSMDFVVTQAVFANDPLPNDDFADPQPVALGAPLEGHLNFLYDNTADHYGITLPTDGMMRIIAEAEQFDTVGTSIIEVYVDQSNTYAYIPVGASSVSGVDTFLFDCLHAGLVRVRLQPGNAQGCGISYRVRFELVPPAFGNDPEPNESAAEATVVPPDTDQDGHIAYLATSSYDHFKLWKGFAGTMRVIFSSSTDGPSPALNVWTLNANVNENITTGEDGAVAGDTVLVYTTAPDTIILRVSPVQFGHCGSYRFHYESTAVGIDDPGASAPVITVVPNPSSDGLFTIRVAGFAPLRMWLTDVSGRIVRHDRVEVTHGGLIVDATELPEGIYLARLASADGHWAQVRLVRTR